MNISNYKIFTKLDTAFVLVALLGAALRIFAIGNVAVAMTPGTRKVKLLWK